MSARDYHRALVARLHAAASAHHESTLPDLPTRGHALGLSPAPPPRPAEIIPAARDFDESDVAWDLQLALGHDPWGVKAQLLDATRRWVRVFWKYTASVTVLGDHVTPPEQGTHRIVLDADCGESTVILAADDGSIYVLDVEGSKVREMLLAPPQLRITMPVRHLPEPPWDLWGASAIDPCISEELAHLAGEGSDIAAMMAAGMITVHEHRDLEPPLIRMAQLVAGRPTERSCDGWLRSLPAEAVQVFEEDASQGARAFGEGLLLEARDLGWSSPADVPLALRIERDRWELVREALRDLNAGSSLESVLAAVDEELAGQFFRSTDAGAAADDDRLIMAAALRTDGWWTASGGAACLPLEAELEDEEPELDEREP